MFIWHLILFVAYLPFLCDMIFSYVFLNNLFSFNQSIPVSTPSPSPSTTACFTHHWNALLREVRVPMENQQSLLYHFEKGPSTSPLYLGWTRYPSKENGLQKGSLSTMDKSWSHCQWLNILPKPHTQLWPRFTTPNFVLCRFHHCQSGVSEFILDQVNCLCGYLHHGLDPFACIIALSSL